jgi:hypothetical protein
LSPHQKRAKYTHVAKTTTPVENTLPPSRAYLQPAESLHGKFLIKNCTCHNIYHGIFLSYFNRAYVTVLLRLHK